MEASVLLVSLAIFAQLVAPSLAVPSGNGDGYTINGQVKIQGAQSIGLLGKTSNVKVILNGGEKVTFVRPDGFFSLCDAADPEKVGYGSATLTIVDRRPPLTNIDRHV